MVTKDLYDLLKQQQSSLVLQMKSLKRELDAINILLDEDGVQMEEFSSSQSSRVATMTVPSQFYGGGTALPIGYEKVGIKTDAITWKDYFLQVMNHLKGPIKTTDIATVVVRVNKTMNFNRVRQEAADKLPILVREGKIKVSKGNNRKEGNLYELI
jgi:hypothetical protein